MKTSFTNKIIWITGASSGIGALMARRLSELGAELILTARSEDKLREIAASLPGPSVAIPMDVASEEQVNRTAEQILARYGRIDILINNAGYGVFERVEDASLDTIEDMMNVNYFGTVRCIKAVLPSMRQAGSGHIVNIASMAGKIGSAKSSGYSASKHAVLGFTNCLRQELAGTGIGLTAVNPGPIDTPFFDRADPSGTYVNNVRWFMLKPEKVAEAVIAGIEREKAEVNLPFTANAGVKLYQLFPRLLDRVAIRMLSKK
ncbi:SDR family NAD(P)-dependent oxidoreductase [Paenibacillus aurantius]|uniref:SDR family NAD(P)-dependent oxidoreductase n=1 Tax=Paenibacillus aurantius TaxID=2918900 RepID=A0AA96RES1_9BACL|nr:SDR family NAD(P)-dependent oxidoreductase [Paenibacillus aurantius]WNQ12760.1 SDR family NAD(P)-dependent oxidoreductase [Paenibacillus aurantius]